MMSAYIKLLATCTGTYMYGIHKLIPAIAIYCIATGIAVSYIHAPCNMEYISTHEFQLCGSYIILYS